MSISPFLVDLGARLRTAREALGMTQVDLAEQVDLSRSSIANIEAGNQETTTSTLAALAAAVHLTVGQLFGEEPIIVGAFRPALAAAVRDAIETAQTTQARVARRIGVSAKHINQITTGKVWPAPELVDRMLAACGRRILVDTEPLTPPTDERSS